MIKTNQINIRKFLLSPDKLSRNYTYMQGIDEPTFLGFAFKFSFLNEDYRDASGVTLGDKILGGLLLQGNEIESAINYLERVGKQNEAAMLTEFIAQLKYIENEMPWYFQSISGVEDFFKPQPPGNTWRGKDKILTIDTLETVDMRMSYLANLYRKATYSEMWKRDLLPYDKRRFNAKIIISEIRNLDLILGSVENVLNTAIEKQKNDIQGGVTSYDNIRVASISGSIDYNKSLRDEMSILQSAIDDNMTFHIIELRDCEFIFEDFPWATTLTNQKPDTPASMRFKIKVGNYFERHQYGIWNWILSDNEDWFGYDDTNMKGKYNLNKYKDQHLNWTAYFNPKDGSIESTKLSPKSKEKFDKNNNPVDTKDDSGFSIDSVTKDIASQGPYAAALVGKLDKKLGSEISDITDKAKRIMNVKDIGLSAYENGANILKNLDKIGSLKDVYNAVSSITNLIDSVTGGIKELEDIFGLSKKLKNIFLGQNNANNLNNKIVTPTTRNDEFYPKGSWKNIYDSKTNINKDIEKIIDKNIYDAPKLLDLNKVKVFKNDNIYKLSKDETKNELNTLKVESENNYIKTNISSIENIETSVNKSITKPDLSETSVNKSITKPDLSETSVNNSIVKPGLSETPVNKSVTKPDLSETPVNKSVTKPDLSETPVNKSVTKPDFDETPVNKSVTKPDFGETPINKSVTKPNFDETPVNKSVVKPDFGETSVNKSVTKPNFDETSVNNSITKLDLSETPVNNSITKPDLSETPVNNSITKPDFSKISVNNSIIKPGLSETPVNKSVTKPDFGETSVNKSVIKPDFDETSVNNSITKPDLSETPVNNSITKPDLSGYTPTRIKLGRVNLDGYKPNSRINPKNIYKNEST
jgi:hypothetical protein